MQDAAPVERVRADEPVLAVVIPTFNRARTITRAVGSVLATPRRDIELVVIDDCSIDSTLQVLAAIPDPRLRVLRCAEHGYANRARNLGAARTTAPLIAFLDSDDEFLPGRVDRLLRYFETHPQVDACIDGFTVIQDQRRSISAPPHCRMTGDAFVRVLISHALPLTNSAIAVRRAAFLDVGGFDNDLPRHQDRDLMLRLARRHTVAIGTGGDVVKHQSGDSISRDAAGYVRGLDELLARHDVFRDPVLRRLLGYLIARSFVRELINLRLALAWHIARTVQQSRHLPFGLLTALAFYVPGKRARRAAEERLHAMEAGSTDMTDRSQRPAVLDRLS